ncbi:MAG: lysylphosphatidylglycerol synthase transmembrane domain-containing protein [Planctomycetota bacterium]|nr:lysylphosphatidylglycerol synthase transmembrane domain-containing protein [Planctomycetota bacterium]
MPPQVKSSLRSAFRLVLLAACAGGVVYVFHRNRDDLKLLLHVGPWIAVALAGLFIAQYLLQGLRYQFVLTKVADARIAFAEWFRLFVLSQWLNIFFPQLGNVYRGVQLKKFHGVSYTGYVSSYVAFAWLDTGINLLVTLAVLAAAPTPLRVAGLPAWGFVTALLAGTLLVPPVLWAFLSLPVARNRHLAWLHAKSRQVVGGLRQSVTGAGYLAATVALGAAVFAITTLTFGVCFLGLGVPVSLPALALFCALYKLSTYVIITPGNLGLLELACAVLGEQVHVGMGPGLLACGMVRVAGYAVLAVLAVAMGGLRLLRRRCDIRPEES